MTPLRSLSLGLTFAILGLLVACDREGPSGEEPSRLPGDHTEVLVERLIVDDPQILLARDDLFNTEPAFTWSFDSDTDVAQWQTRGLASARLVRRRWVLKPEDDDPQLMRQLQLDASELHGVEVTLAGLVQGKATLYWAGPGETFTADRSLTVGPPKPRRPRPFTLGFDLSGHPLWGGTVERLRIDPTDSAQDTLKLLSVRGVRRVADPERLAAAFGRGWKIDLSADTRNALLAVPGVPIERQLEVGDDQRLLFAYGLETTVQQAVEFRIEATVEGQEAVDVLFEETLDPAAGAAGSWHEATLDLGAYAGRRLSLSLETRTPRLLDLARGFAAWGNPEILARAPLAPLEEGEGQEDEPPNIILISIDTLRSDRLSAYGHHRETSPNLDQWAANAAVLFENAVVQAPWTLPSHASMFTGLEALRHDVNHYQEAPASLELLAETLRRAGYATAAITGGGYLRPKFGFAQGFDVFRYWPQILAERELADGTEKLLSWLDANHARRFFLLFHTYEVHFPHRERQPYFDQFTSGEPVSKGDSGEVIRGKFEMRARTQEPSKPLWQHDYFTVKLPSGEEVEHLNTVEKALIRTRYDSAIAYVDAQLGKLFERIDALGLRGRTLIILTSDHGEALGEKDRAGHNYLEDYNVMVPLVIELPDGRGAGKRIDSQVRSIDIVPTILDVVGISPPRPVDGVSLLPLIAGDASSVPGEAWTYASSANYGLGLRYRNQLKFMFNNTAWAKFLGDEQLYNLRQDPSEEDDQAGRHPSTGELQGKVRQAIETQHEGLRLRIHNRGEGRLSGRLKYDWARHNRVKAADATCRCLSWSPDRKPAFSLAPNQELTLYFESIPGNRLGLEGQLELPGQSPVAFDEVFDPRQISAPIAFEYASGGWRRKEAPEGEQRNEASESASLSDASVAFTIWRKDERVGSSVSLPVDEKLQAQLRALGYIN